MLAVAERYFHMTTHPRNLSAGLLLLALLAFPCAVPAAGDQDAEGSKDHPLFPNRMPGFYISQYEQKDFDAVDMEDAKGEKTQVEGQRTTIMYVKTDGAQEPSRVQILRNYQNAFTKIGGKVVVADHDGSSFLRLVQGSRQVWVQVDAYVTFQYRLIIVEKGGMQQDITANAAAFSNDLGSTGHAAVYGIYFDTGKADVKPESGPALDEIAKLLKGQAALKVHIVGHTDNTGSLDTNMKLSQARADAVAQALVAKYGIDKARLRSFGVASLAPVASNDTDEGKAKNRRVELVKP